MAATATITQTTPTNILAVEVAFPSTHQYDYPVFSAEEGPALVAFAQAYAENNEIQYKQVAPNVVNEITGATGTVLVSNGDNTHLVRVIFNAGFVFPVEITSDLGQPELDVFLQAYADQYEAAYKAQNANIIA